MRLDKKQLIFRLPFCVYIFYIILITIVFRLSNYFISLMQLII